MNVATPFTEWAVRMPHQAALIEDGRAISYRQLDAAVCRAAAFFEDSGLAAGRVVAVAGTASAFMQLVVALALTRLGAAQLALPAGDPPERQIEMMRQVRADALLAMSPEAELPQMAIMRPDPAWVDDGAPPARQTGIAAGGDAVWVINHSSGTTGRPKAMPITHAMESVRLRLQPAEFACRPGERFMSLTSFDFWLGRSRAIRCLCEGGTVVAVPGQNNVAATLAAIAEHRVVHLNVTPAHLYTLLGHLPETGLLLPGVRVLRVSSAALPAKVLREITHRATPHIYANYGANEAGNVTLATPEMLARFPTTVGKRAPGMEIELLDPHGRPVAPGVIGQVRVRSQGMIRGYIDDVPATAAAFRDGWFYPGDLAVVDDEGFYFLKGRIDDVMNYDGMLISPDEIEAVLLEHHAVAEAVAFKLPSERHQDVPAAAVVLRSDADLQQIKDFCGKRLHRRAPHMIFQITAVPRNRMGKSLRRSMGELVLASLPGPKTTRN